MELKNTKPIRAAVATKDGISINLHFGHAKTFWIYELHGDQFTLLEKRDVDHYCRGGSGDASAMQKILQSLTDCRWVFVARIGDGPIAKLNAIGVEPVDEFAHLGIDEALQAYARRLDEPAGGTAAE
ncbi:NifB/NifX family molybdenum-iron cluster-binding protein [Pontiella sp.]|uniref:NifB/NifX family molybdenum-iron cluster-binding protein n=1 Tax=Pontiella sp. TaxID=2837462 RepID=UPI00356577D9